MIDFIKDADCTKETPVKLGVPDAPIYGKGIKLKPRVDGKTDSEHFKKIYLPELLPLEEYDLIVVLISGGKDSVACYLKLLELGVPKERIEFWHHDIDGGHPSRRMDWKCTQNYVKALADAEGIKLRVSYRVNGFFGELYRIGASEPIEWIDPDTGEVKQCKLSSNYLKCKELKEQVTEEMEELLKKYGYRMKFPAKTGDLSRRWCSAYLKICVADTVVSNLDRLGELEELGGKRHKFPAKGGTHSGRWCSGNLKAAVQDSVTANLKETKRDKKILIVSGERRGESAGRSKYNEMEIHRTNAEIKAHRIVHQWRCCIDYSEKDVWELLKRHHINPHPCYRIGWNRCSCMMCIFSTPRLFAGVKELFPDDYAALRHDEEVLGFTLDNKKNLDEFILAWKCSPRRMMQIKGFLYYDGDHDVIHRKRTMIGEDGKLEVVENLPNNRIVDNQYAKMVNQKANYLFGKPFTLSGDNEQYIELLKKVFDKKFMRTLKSAGKAAYNGGIAWLYPYYNDRGEFAFRLFPAYEILPFWKDSEHTELDFFIRLYVSVAYDGTQRKYIEKVELYDLTGVHLFILDGSRLQEKRRSSFTMAWRLVMKLS